MVKDKINFRTQGPRTALTRQPVSGRANDGGLRIGEMERDSLISHGATNFLTESLMERSDKYFMAVCNKTGMIAVYNPDKDLFLSPMADGPLKFVGSLAEENLMVEKVSRHGRVFSIVRIPYALKLLIQELQTINVVMRLITDDNIDQIENLTFSKNLNILLDDNRDVKEYVSDLHNKARNSGMKLRTIEKESEEVSPAYAPASPEYAPGSPAYVPDSSDSIPYAVDTSDSSDTPIIGGEIPDLDELPGYMLSKRNDMKEDFISGSFDGPLSGGPLSDAYYEGGGKKRDEFAPGALVSLNSYMGQPNLWVVKTVGPEFITIVHPENEGDIHVVQPEDIRPANQAPMPFYQPQQIGPIGQMGPMMPASSQPPMNIVLINGNDNKLGENQLKKSGGESFVSNGGGVDSSPIGINTGTSSEASATASSSASSEKKEDSGFSIFDTMNFLVKKST